MKIVTICNYPDQENFNAMCIAWGNQIKKYCGNMEVEVLVEKSLPELVRKSFDENNIKISIKQRKENKFKFNASISNKAQHNIFFKMYNLCNLTEPYIFIDADAFLLTGVEDLIEASKDKPFIAVDHEKIPKHCAHIQYKFLNTGMMVVSDPSFLDFDKKISILKRDRTFKYPGTDQSLVNSYVKEMNYDYSHELVGYGWNHCAGYTKFINGDKAICSGLGDEYPINLNHYWHEFKPWNVNCPIYENTLKELK